MEFLHVIIKITPTLSQ